jgi:RNA polymerase sigma-70 factor, ECF subfamily
MESDGNSALLATFLSRWPPAAPVSDEQEMQAALERAVEEARNAWTSVDMPSEQFVAYMAERADGSLAPLEALTHLKVPDLYLACGCAGGNTQAIAAFEAVYLAALRPAVARIDPGSTDEVIQQLRVTLLMGNEESPEDREPKIGQYRGRGTLKGWLEVSAKRLALALARRGADDHLALDELTIAAPAFEPQLEQLRARYSDDFRQLVKAAVRQALAGLSFEERNLLRWHLVDNVSLRKLALVRNTNVSKLSRDYAHIRASILAHVRDALCQHTGLPGADVDSIIGALLSRISISISVVLAQAAG